MTKVTAQDIGPFIANKANALRLIEWLDRGAPHAVFNIDYGSLGKESSHDFEMAFETAVERGDTHGHSEEDCGSIVCIGGAAAQMAVGEFGQLTDLITPDMGWDEIQEKALEYLGITPTVYDNVPAIWPIFDPDEWPRDEWGQSLSTGKGAATALVHYSKHGNCEAAIAAAFE